MNIKHKIEDFMEKHMPAIVVAGGIAIGAVGFALGEKHADKLANRGLEKVFLVNPEIKDLMLDAFEHINTVNKLN